MKTVALPQGRWVEVEGPLEEDALRYARAKGAGVEVSETDEESRGLLASGTVDPLLEHALV